MKLYIVMFLLGWYGVECLPSKRLPCRSDIHCLGFTVCKDSFCQPVCDCPTDRVCRFTGTNSVCDCPKNYEDQNGRCVPTTGSLCDPSPCGNNTDCMERSKRPVCTCKVGYGGDPLTGCTQKCDSDIDCPTDKYCLQGQCVDPCSKYACGTDASCRVTNYIPICFCLPGYEGNPFVACRKRCDSNIDCPSNRMCKEDVCVDSCSQFCGTDATCVTKNNKAVCSCPSGYGGNPLVACNKRCANNIDCHSDKMCLKNVCVDPCSQNVCGTDTICRAKKQQPLCSCRSGYEGNPLEACSKKCDDNTDCPLDRMCFETKCVDPCSQEEICGDDAVCEVKDQAATCTCPERYTGSPYRKCIQIADDF